MDRLGLRRAALAFRRGIRRSAAAVMAMAVSLGASASDKIPVTDFLNSGLTGWEEHSFEGNTEYKLSDGELGKILLTSSTAAASGLVKALRVDLDKTPYLNWRWKIDKPLIDLVEDTKAGDDYAARIYVIIDGGWLFWRTKALNFVWSSRDQSRTGIWPNPFAPDNALMMAVRDKSDGINRWLTERVNVKDALEQWLGEDVSHIDGVAIMTDTDNSGLSAGASFGELYFSSE